MEVFQDLEAIGRFEFSVVEGLETDIEGQGKQKNEYESFKHVRKLYKLYVFIDLCVKMSVISGRKNKIKMRFSCYEWRPSRVNPEFTGIASRYSNAKNQRLEQERRRLELESDHSYTANLDSSLNKTLESKMLELLKLKEARRRHLEDLKFVCSWVMFRRKKWRPSEGGRRKI